MKLVFRGWQRELKEHNHLVAPVDFKGGEYVAKSQNQPMTWNGPFSALGKVNNLSLSGAFLVEFEFQEKELQSWLEQYVKADPASALRLLAQAQAEALIALSRQTNS